MFNFSRTTRSRGSLFLVVIIALIATACSQTSNTTDTAASSTSAPETIAFEEQESSTTTAPEMATIAVAARNSIDTSPLWIADSQGIFEKYGIEIQYVPVADEGAVVGSLISDEARIGVLSSTSILSGVSALRSDLFEPLVYISGTDTRAESGRGSISLIAPDGSPIRTGCDLEGKTVAVDGPATSAAIAVREMIINDGCNSSLVKLLVQDTDQTVSGLRSGDLDAAATLDPLTARVLRGPNRLIENLDGQLCPDYGQCPLSVAMVDLDWAEINPEAAEGFRRAMNEAISWIRTNEIEYRAELVNCCSVDVDDASQSAVPNFVGDRRNLTSDLERLQGIVSTQLETKRATDAALRAAEDNADSEATEEATEADAAAEPDA